MATLSAGGDELRALAYLSDAPGRAALASELRASIDASAEQVDAILERLERSGAVVVVDHPPPDPCLAGLDLRVVAAAEPVGAGAAQAAATQTWDHWLRVFRSSHRCC